MNNNIIFTESEKMRIYMAMLSENEVLDEGVVQTIWGKIKDMISGSPVLGKLFNVIKTSLGDEIKQIVYSDAPAKQKFEELKALAQQNKDMLAQQVEPAVAEGMSDGNQVAMGGLIGANIAALTPMIMAILGKPPSEGAMAFSMVIGIFMLVLAATGMLQDMFKGGDTMKRRNANIMGRT